MSNNIKITLNASQARGEANKLKDTLGAVDKAFKSMDSTLNRIKAVLSPFAKDLRRVGGVMATLLSQVTKVPLGLNKFLGVVLKLKTPLTSLIKMVAKNIFAVFTAGVLAAGVAIKGLYDVTLSLFQGLYQAQVKLDQFFSVMAVASGSTAGARKEMEYLTDAALKMGFSLSALQVPYAKLAASARGTTLEGEKTRKLFEAMAKTAVTLHLGTEDLQYSFFALQQMVSKGKVSMEELRRQLGERIPAAVVLGAKAMNMSMQEFEKALKQGAVMSEDFVPKFTEQLNLMYSSGFQVATRGMKAASSRIKTKLDALVRTFLDVSHHGEKMGLMFSMVFDGMKESEGTVKRLALVFSRFLDSLTEGAILLTTNTYLELMVTNVDNLIRSIASVDVGGALGLNSDVTPMQRFIFALDMFFSTLPDKIKLVALEVKEASKWIHSPIDTLGKEVAQIAANISLPFRDNGFDEKREALKDKYSESRLGGAHTIKFENVEAYNKELAALNLEELVFLNNQLKAIEGVNAEKEAIKDRIEATKQEVIARTKLASLESKDKTEVLETEKERLEIFKKLSDASSVAMSAFRKLNNSAKAGTIGNKEYNSSLATIRAEYIKSTEAQRNIATMSKLTRTQQKETRASFLMTTEALKGLGKPTEKAREQFDSMMGSIMATSTGITHAVTKTTERISAMVKASKAIKQDDSGVNTEIAKGVQVEIDNITRKIEAKTKLTQAEDRYIAKHGLIVSTMTDVNSVVSENLELLSKGATKNENVITNLDTLITKRGAQAEAIRAVILAHKKENDATGKALADFNKALAQSIQLLGLEGVEKEYQIARNQLGVDVLDAETEALIRQKQAKLDLIAHEKKGEQASGMFLSPTDELDKGFEDTFDKFGQFFNEDQMTNFYKAWGKAQKGINKQLEATAKSKFLETIDPSVSDIAEKWYDVGKSIQGIVENQKDYGQIVADGLHTDEEIAAMKKKDLTDQVNMYSQLTGAIGNMFEEGSKGAMAFNVISKTLALTSAIGAMIEAWRAPFPANIANAAMTTAAVVSLLAQIGQTVSGSGGGSVSAMDAAGANQIAESVANEAMLELVNQPILDRLDRQIELLEIIGLEGTAGRATIDQSKFAFNNDLAMLAEEIIQGTQYETVRAGDVYGTTAAQVDASWDAAYSKANEISGQEIFKRNVNGYYNVAFNGAGFRANPLASFGAMIESGSLGTLGNWKDAAEAGINVRDAEALTAWSIANGKKQAEAMQEVSHDYIVSMSQVVESMTDAKDSFKDMYDELTNSSFFEDRDLENAKARVKSIIGDGDLAEYMKQQILVIEDIESHITKDITSLFLSRDPADLTKQAEALDMLNAAMGGAFEGGVQDALDYLDAIELVADSMVSSAQEAIDKQTEMYEAQIDVLEKALSGTTEKITSLKSALVSLDNIIEKLRAPSRTPEASIAKFYNDLSSAKSLSGSSDITDITNFQKALETAISSSAALFDSTNFSSTRDMQFEQLVAANEFEAMEVVALEQIDYLKLIEVNTRNQIDAILLLIESLGQKIDESLLPKAPEITSAQNAVSAGYQAILDRAPDTGGGAHWTATLEQDPNITNSNLLSSINASAYSGGELSAQQMVANIYEQGLGRTADAGGLAFWSAALESGALTADNITEELRKTAIRNGETYTPFATGSTNIPFDMNASIHQGEIIVPQTFSEGIRRGDVTIGDSVSKEDLEEQNRLLRGIISELQKQNSTSEDTNDILNESLIKLEDIEEVI